jgi:hypothetical protein
MSEIQLQTEDILCPVHKIPDCSPLLNGCSIPNVIADRIRRKVTVEVAKAIELERYRIGLGVQAVVHNGDHTHVSDNVGACVCGRMRPCGGPHDCAMM